MEELQQKWHLTPEDEIWSILPQDATVFRTVLKYECNLNPFRDKKHEHEQIFNDAEN